MDERGGRPRVLEGKEAVAGSNLRARLPPQPGRAGTALPGRQAMDPAGGARDPGLLRWICWRREEERERGNAAAGRRTGRGRRVAVGSARVRG